MIGNLNKKIFFLILLVPLLFSCGNVETDNETDNETGRYQVIERKYELNNNDIRGWEKEYGVGYAPATYHHSYYLLDTKTGEIKEIDFSEIE